MYPYVCLLAFPEPLEVSKNEWYNVVTNCLGHGFSPYCLPRVAKIQFSMHKML